MMTPFFIPTIKNYVIVHYCPGTIRYRALHAYTYQPGGPESVAQLLHQTFTLPVLLNEGEQVPTHKQRPSTIQPW